MTSLVSVALGPAHPLPYQYLEGDATTPEIGWEVLRTKCFKQLLTSCSVLTTLSMEGVALDQAGLDLLLAHPLIVKVELLAIAATESRVDSPCSWQTLTLAKQVDVRTVAYVPLHSLQQPLSCQELLLPPDVPPEQLPPLLLKAATRIAEHRHLFSIAGECLHLVDHIVQLSSMRWVQWRGEVQPAFSPTAQSALFAALEPLASISSIEELVFCFHYDSSPEGPPPRVRVGKTAVEALSSTWGARINSLRFDGIALGWGFFPALETCFPHLEWLGLENVATDGPSLEARILVFCQRMTRPLTLCLEEGLYDGCTDVMLEFWPTGAPQLQVTLEPR